MNIRHILVPVDFSDDSQAVVDRAVELARVSRASLTLYHVHEPARAPSGEYDASVDRLELARLEAEEEQLRKWAVSLRPRVDAGFLMQSGSPWECIVHQAATSSADLIVMGTHGRSGVKRLFLGSVAERVVQHAPCSVMVVRPGPAPPPGASKSGRRTAAAPKRSSASPTPENTSENEVEIFL
jgi:universal stress protein A